MFICCICGKLISGYGNNPWPISFDPNSECCDDCNDQFVIPARLRSLYTKRGDDDAKNV